MSDPEKGKKKRLKAEWESRNKMRQRQWASSGLSLLQQVLGEDDMAREQLQQAGWSVDLLDEERRSLISKAFKDNYWEIIWLLQHYSRSVEEIKNLKRTILRYPEKVNRKPWEAEMVERIERQIPLKFVLEEDIRYFKKLK